MRQSGFGISRNVVELDDETMMYAVYIEGAKR
jgi:hypothetical protein